MLYTTLVIVASIIVFAVLLGTKTGMLVLGAAIILVPTAALVFESWGWDGLVLAWQWGVLLFAAGLFGFHFIRAWRETRHSPPDSNS